MEKTAKRIALAAAITGAMVAVGAATWFGLPRVTARVVASFPEVTTTSLNARWNLERTRWLLQDGPGLTKLVRVRGASREVVADSPEDLKAFGADCVVYLKTGIGARREYWLACGLETPRVILRPGNEVWRLVPTGLEHRVWSHDAWTVANEIGIETIKKLPDLNGS